MSSIGSTFQLAAGQIPIRIVATAEYVPVGEHLSEAFDQRWSKTPGWTEQQVGIRSRRFASGTETSSSMAAHAAEQALQRAGLSARDIDCLISACSVMEQTIPCNAALVHHKLGLSGSGIPAFDINATCLSFLVALDNAACLIQAGRFNRIMIVSSEIASAGLNWDDQETAAMFGDGAAAVIVERCDEKDRSRLVAAHFATYSEGYTHCQVRSGGTRIRVRESLDEFLAGAVFEMNGKAVYGLAARRVPGFLRKLWAKANIDPNQLAHIVPHQASVKAIEHMTEALGFNPEKISNILPDHGNQLAASIPVALHKAIENGQIQRGQHFALLGTGAGFSIGAAVMVY